MFTINNFRVHDPSENACRASKSPLRALYVEKEDSIDATRRKFQKMLGGTYNIAEVGEPDNWQTYVGNYTGEQRSVILQNFVLLGDPMINDDPAMLSNPRHIQWLVRQAKKHRADLVVIDTYKASFDVDENDNNQVAQKVIEPVKQVMREANCSVLLLHHCGTDDGRMRGATALEGACRWIVKITPVSEDDPMRPSKQKRIPGHFRLEHWKAKVKELPDTFHRINNEGDNLRIEEPTHPAAIAMANGETYKSAHASPEAKKARRSPEDWQTEVRLALLERERRQPGEWVTAPTLANEMGGRVKAVRDALNALSVSDTGPVERRGTGRLGEFEYRMCPVIPESTSE